VSRLLRVVLAGFVSLAAMSVGRAVQAQATIDPVFFGGVVGDPLLRDLQSPQGAVFTFSEPYPSISSLSASSLWNGGKFQVIRSTADADNNFTTLQIRRALPEYTAPSVESSTLEYRQGTTVVGTGEVYAIIFSTANYRDAFIYYLQQQDQSATYADYVYTTAHLNYVFWMGQENQGQALYSLYTGLGD
jgi:hypothetical protein